MGNLIRRYYRDTTGIRKQASKWYGDFFDGNGIRQKVPLAANKEAAKVMLADLERKADRQKTGLTDRFEEWRKIPLANHLTDWKRILTNADKETPHTRLITSRACEILGRAQVIFLSDISASLIMDAINAIVQEKNHSAQTKAHLVQAVKQFGRWLVRDQRWASNSLAFLAVSRSSIREDQRHARRAFSEEELCWLFQTTRLGPKRLHWSGIDRSFLWRIAAFTGLRRAELATLTPKSFQDGTVHLGAKHTKNSRDALLPMPPALWDDLVPWLAKKQKNALLFGERFARDLTHFSKCLKRDMKTARTEWLASGGNPEGETLLWEDGKGRFADGHALRATYITMLAKSGASVKEFQVLARHADAKTTLSHYLKITSQDLSNVVSRLPEISLAIPKMVGFTDPVTAPLLPQKSDIQRQRLSVIDHSGVKGAHKKTTRNPVVPAFSSGKQAVHPVGFEPTTPGLGNRCSIP